ncbi:MAG: helicase-related protein [Thermoanaerobaculia bacterium]
MLAEHQREAVTCARELLETRGGVLLADDVGLGKSYVAAEVMRHYDSELIVPAALVEQWRGTLKQFGIDTNILTHDGIVHDPFVPQPRRRLIVVDEAHAFRNPKTQRYAALARRTIGARVLLVTATPVCNALADLEALLRLIARDDLLAGIGVPSIDAAFELRDSEAIERIVGALVIRRDRTVLPDALRFGELERRVIRYPILDAPVLDALRFGLFLRRRLESSEAALIESIRRQLRFYERALAAVANGRALPKREYRQAFAHEEDLDAFQDVLFWELFAPAGESDPHAMREEMRRLEELLALARASPNTKRNLLVELVQSEREPMLIFTGSIATACDLQEVLQCGLVTSKERSRDAVLRAFQRGRIDVVVSTDMAAEGLNLQRAGVIMHYDIPWNPVKLDQRNGRAHRIGQTRPSVGAIYFVPERSNTKIMQTVARKNRIRKRAMHATPLQPEARRPTLRPRVTSDSAYMRLQSRAAIPDRLARRHKAGIEQLMLEMSSEYLDQRKLDDLLALVDAEV